MSIEQTDIVDAIGVDRGSGRVVLTISDHLGWEDEQTHLRYLQEKLNTYIRFVESGELLEAYPEANGRTAAVDIVTRVPMPTVGLEFLEQVRATLDSVGLTLQTRQLK